MLGGAEGVAHGGAGFGRGLQLGGEKFVERAGFFCFFDRGIGDADLGERLPGQGAAGAAFEEIEDIALGAEPGDAESGHGLREQDGEIDLLLQVAHAAGEERAGRGAIGLQHRLEGEAEPVRFFEKQRDEPVAIDEGGVKVPVAARVEQLQDAGDADPALLQERVELDAFFAHSRIRRGTFDAISADKPRDLDGAADLERAIETLGFLARAPCLSPRASPGQLGADVDQDVVGLIGHGVKRESVRFRSEAEKAFERGFGWFRDRESVGSSGGFSLGSGSAMMSMRIFTKPFFWCPPWSPPKPPASTAERTARSRSCAAARSFSLCS